MKMILMLLVSFAVIAFYCWFAYELIILSEPFISYSSLLLIIGISAVLIFGLIAVIITFKLLDNKPGLSIDNFGLVDNSSLPSRRQINWTEIEDISMIEIGLVKLITIQLKDTHAYINKQNCKYKRILHKMNWVWYGAPICLSSITLQINALDLLILLKEKWKENK